ncbi:MAG TPA: PilZ domain-containing protein [Candidatus Omnitrophota bacterium]|nr:PilZ domain-containing protein [Candidatus Omnitrophota bacterium]
MSYSNRERRQFPRKEIGIPVNYHVLGVIENLKPGQTKNSSIGGFLLTTERKLQRGVSLVLEVPWPSRLQPLRLIGRVVESAPGADGVTYDTRIEFLAIDDAHRDLIARMMEFYQHL